MLNTSLKMHIFQFILRIHSLNVIDKSFSTMTGDFYGMPCVPNKMIYSAKCDCIIIDHLIHQMNINLLNKYKRRMRVNRNKKKKHHQICHLPRWTKPPYTRLCMPLLLLMIWHLSNLVLKVNARRHTVHTNIFPIVSPHTHISTYQIEPKTERKKTVAKHRMCHVLMLRRRYI